MRWIWREETREGCMPPTRFHGVAYDIFPSSHPRPVIVVWYPVPWNLVVRWSRVAWFGARNTMRGRWAARSGRRCPYCGGER